MNTKNTLQHVSTLLRPRVLITITVAVSLVGTTGCERRPKRLEVFPVAGKVTFAGKAPAGANVVFHPVSADPNHPRPSGVVGPDGSFTVKTYGDDQGAPPGKYKVTMQLYKPKVKGDEVEIGKNLLPPKYADAQKTDVQVEVLASDNHLPPITLKR
jgi:hypothetical protein